MYLPFVFHSNLHVNVDGLLIMTRRVLKNLDFLNALCQCNTTQKNQLLKSARPEVINAVCDCIHNVLIGTVPISDQKKRKLESKKNILRKIIARKTKAVQRKRLLTQKGSGLLPLLPLILGPALGQLLNKI